MLFYEGFIDEVILRGAAAEQGLETQQADSEQQLSWPWPAGTSLCVRDITAWKEIWYVELS